MALNSKHALGSKENIESAKATGAINEHDILFLNNREIGWIAKDGSTVMSTSRTQEDISVNGVTGDVVIEASSGLPEVTAENNGAFLRVVDGAWAIVNLTDVSVEGA